MRNRKKVYRFSDEVMAKDTIISFIFGLLSLIIIIVSVIMSIVMKGNVPEQTGYLLLAALIMGITAFMMGVIAYKDQDGGVLSKRTSVLISVLDIVILIVMYIA